MAAESLRSFLEMGGYAAYVWPAYATAAVVLGGLLAHAMATLRRRERALAALQERPPQPAAAARPA